MTASIFGTDPRRLRSCGRAGVLRRAESEIGAERHTERVLPPSCEFVTQNFVLPASIFKPYDLTMQVYTGAGQRSSPPTSHLELQLDNLFLFCLHAVRGRRDRGVGRHRPAERIGLLDVEAARQR